MTEPFNRSAIIDENGAVREFTAPSPPKTGFTAGETWDGDYDFTPAGVNAKGTIPMPNQTKIDNYSRTMAKLYFELEEAAREEQTAKDALSDEEDTRSAEERLAEYDKAQAILAKAYESFAEPVAKLCSNKPTATQLKGLPHGELTRFINYISGQLDPNA